MRLTAIVMGIAGATLFVSSTQTFASQETQQETFTVQNDTTQWVRTHCFGSGPAFVVQPDQTKSGISCANSGDSNRIHVSLTSDGITYGETFDHDCADVKKITVEEDVEGDPYTIDGSLTTTGEDVTVTPILEFAFTDSCE